MAEWNDGRGKSWKRFFELLGLHFPKSLASHLAEKDEKREKQRTERASVKDEKQNARKAELVEKILEHMPEDDDDEEHEEELIKSSKERQPAQGEQARD